MSSRTKRSLRLAGSYFLVFFAVLLGYRFIEAEYVRHVPFVFDPIQNLALPAFTAVVGFVTGMFSRR